MNPSPEDILQSISEEMDLMHNVTAYSWRLRIHPAIYQILKDWDKCGRPSWYKERFYTRDGVEYIRAIYNTTIPFFLDYRVVLDDTRRLEKDFGCLVELDVGEMKYVNDDDEWDDGEA